MSKTHDQIGALVILLVCIVAWIHSSRFPFEAQVFPRMVLAFLAALSIAMLVRASLRRDPPAAGLSAFFLHRRRFAFAIVAILAYIVVVSHLGYFTTTLVFLPLMAACLGYRHPTNLALASLGFCVVSYLVFVALFERPLPPERLLELLQ